MERTWADQYVIPYVRDVYPDEVTELRRWLADQSTEHLASILHTSKSCSFCRTLLALARRPRLN
jgi:hypothetical protein